MIEMMFVIVAIGLFLLVFLLVPRDRKNIWKTVARPEGKRNNSQTKRKWGFHVHLPEGLVVSGVIITDQIKNLDFRARNIEIKGKAPEEVVQTCLKKIRTFL